RVTGTWREIPELNVGAGRHARGRLVVLRVLIPLAIAVVLWQLGLEIAAGLVVVAAAVLAVTTYVWPTFAARLEHVLSRFGHWVGRAIAVVLLTLVNVLFFAPVAFVMWVVRFDPLAPGKQRDAPSFWHGHVARSFPKRQFADERAIFLPVGAVAIRRRPALRVATVVGIVSLMLVADLTAGWIYDQVSDASRRSAAYAVDFDPTSDPAGRPAFRDSPWVSAMLAENIFEHSIVYDTYLGYRLGTYRGRYTNVIDGVRASAQPAASPKLSVWFFGGSSLFGFGQRDAHTIPSEFARIAEAQGIPVEVRNYGRSALSMWQELELFEQVASAQDKPDLVVFYDGFNDLASQMNTVLSPNPVNILDATADPTRAASADPTRAASAGLNTTAKGKAPAAASTATSSTDLSDVASAYWDQSASRRVYDAISGIFGGSDEPSAVFATGARRRETTNEPAPDASLEAAKNTVSIQARAATLATAFANSLGAQAAFFWQPSVFTKQLLPEETPYLGFPSYEPARWDPAVRRARQLLRKTPIVDLGSALDAATTPVLWDFVHTNEEGARLIAEAMFTNLEAKLRAELSTAKSSTR
ncbi:MAG: hypothetical protein ABWY80_03550, partial [Acidimicrobiia bacterium]